MTTLLNNKLIFGLSLRLFLSLYISLNVLTIDPYRKAFVFLFLTLYVSTAILNYLYPGKLGWFSRFIDLILIPPVLFSQNPNAVLALLPLMVYHTNRDFLLSLVLLWFSTGIYIYHAGMYGLKLLPFFFGLFIASLVPDLNYVLNKERKYVKRLRKSYWEMSKDLANLEKERVEKSYMEFLFKSIEESTLEDYLKRIKEKFSLERIAIVPKSGPIPREPLLSKEEKALYVPVYFDKGHGYVIFYMHSPFQLYDKALVSSLEKSAKLLNLYIEGFDESTKKDVVAIAV